MISNALSHLSLGLAKSELHIFRVEFESHSVSGKLPVDQPRDGGLVGDILEFLWNWDMIRANLDVIFTSLAKSKQKMASLPTCNGIF